MIRNQHGGLRALVAALGVLGLFAIASPAVAATTISATVGPVPVPGVPVVICVDDGTPVCTPTAPATTVALTVSVTVNPDAVIPPTVTPGTCPAGSQGVVLIVTGGSAGTVISGFVVVTVNGNPTTIPLPTTPVLPNQTVTVSACVSPGVALPGLPGVPGVPGVPGLPGLPV